MIHEVIVTTLNEDGTTHIAPMGVRFENNKYIIAPFKPSATLNNILREKTAVINRTNDVRIFAGCLTGRKNWETVDSNKINTKRLVSTLSHVELELEEFRDDELRTTFFMNSVNEVTHSPFTGFNRAQSAILEAAILVSRLEMLSDEKICDELKYLRIAIDKTAGECELEAWNWLMEKIEKYQTENNKVLIA